MSALAARVMVTEPVETPDEAPARVAVLIPAYNAGSAINSAVESLLNNTLPCDIYIVDDGSKIPVAQILDDFPRTKVIRLDKNAGVPRALNVGLKEILKHPYEFVARLDAQDFCYAERLEQQVAFLDSHPDVGAVGCWARFVDPDSGKAVYIERTPDEPALAKQKLHLNSVILHPTLMVRTDVIRDVGPYSERYPVAEDYELFRRIAQKFPIVNIPTVLVDTQLSVDGVSITRRRRQLLDRLKIQLAYFRPLEPYAWIGLIKTFGLFLIPRVLVTKFKSFIYRV
jgi:glycosyltransferase involved in cell wall biosynthesis